MTKSIKIKNWTPHQLNRLPDSGYWIDEFNWGDGKLTYTLYCIMNGRIKYIRSGFGRPQWSTLLWSCMPTKKQIELSKSDTASNSTYYHYKTIQEVQQNFPGLPNEFYTKPDNDF